MMRYLITGSTGICGKYIVKELLSDPLKYNVEQIATISRQSRYSYDDHPDKVNPTLLECYGDLTKNCIRIISQFRPTHIIHCAGEGRQNAPAKDIWRSNVDTTLNLLEACKCLDKVKFVYCSSFAIHNDPLNVYGASKIAGETLVRSYAKTNDNLKGCTCRFPAVAGAGNKHGVLRDIIAKLLDKSSPFKMNLLGKEPGSIKPFVYAGQLASDILFITGEHKDSSRYNLWNISALDNISVKDIAELAMSEVGFKKEIVWSNEFWPGDQKFVLNELSDFSMYSSIEAIKLSIKDILREDYGYAV